MYLWSYMDPSSRLGVPIRLHLWIDMRLHALGFNDGFWTWNHKRCEGMWIYIPRLPPRQWRERFHHVVGKWDMSKVTDTGSMFKDASAFNSDIKMFVHNMFLFFFWCLHISVFTWVESDSGWLSCPWIFGSHQVSHRQLRPCCPCIPRCGWLCHCAS